MKASIKAISYYLPPDKYTNDDYFHDFPELLNNTNIARLGILERRIVMPEQTASDLAVQSAIKLFEEHSINKNDIGFIIFCAQEFDYYLPATACIIQERLGIPQIKYENGRY
jgi:3-oxoacyl-[acyl-carrier-protein] synthase-3